MRDTNEQLEEAAAAAAEAERAKTTKAAKIPVPKKYKDQKGPSYAMGDIVAFLETMPEVDNANDYYQSAQVSPSGSKQGSYLHMLYRDS
jgi:hypothetical protein